MPNRYVREAAITSKAVNSLSWQGEVFWRRLLNKADDFGRFSADPQLLRSEVFPRQLDRVREADISRLLAECEKAGLLFRFEAHQKPYLVMNQWETGRAKTSKYPPPPDDICKHLQTYVYTLQHMSPTPTPTPTPDSDTDKSGRDAHALSAVRMEMPEVEVPSWSEVQAECQKVGLVEWRARDWFDEMEQSGWRDNKGREVMKWRPYLARVKSWWERDGRPMQPPVKAGDRAMTPMSIKMIIEAKNVKAAELRAKYCSDTAIDAIWSDPQKRQEYFAMKKEIKALNTKLSNMA